MEINYFLRSGGGKNHRGTMPLEQNLLVLTSKERGINIVKLPGVHQRKGRGGGRISVWEIMSGM